MSNITKKHFILVIGCQVLSLVCFWTTEAFATVDQVNDSMPIEVQVGIQVDQIVNVDQKSENFTIVGNFLMVWKDSRYAFDPAECECEEKTFTTSQFEKFATENSLIWPRFIFYNQQGNRWTQEEVFVVHPSGIISYVERFTVTLQAPDFDFVKYPFDTQKFDIHVVSLWRDNSFVFVADSDTNKMGAQLGEEEWLIGPHTNLIDNVTLLEELGDHSQFSFSFQAQRHLDYYIYRIFLPLFLIITVAYATFFMKDYGKRVDYSSANLMTFVMFNFTVGADLPRLGYQTFTDSILILTFVMTAVTVISNVIMKRLSISGKESVVLRWDGIILWGYPLLYTVGFGWVYFIYLG